MILRMVALKDASTVGTACACVGAGQGTIVDLGGNSYGNYVAAALHMLSCQANTIRVFVQGNSSSGYSAGNPGTDYVAFTSCGARGSQWQSVPWNCASATSTDRKFWRAAWTQTCTDTDNWLLGVSVP